MDEVECGGECGDQDGGGQKVGHSIHSAGLVEGIDAKSNDNGEEEVEERKAEMKR